MKSVESKLPPLLREIADCVGVDNAMKLSKELGGQRFRIPRAGTINKDHPFVRAVGIGVAGKIAHAFRGMRIEVPMFGRKLARNDEIRRAHADGESTSALAIRFCMAVRHVRRVLKQK